MARSLLSCLMVTALLVGFSATASAEMLVNGGFEDGDPGVISAGVPGWNVWGPSGWHHDDAGRTIDSKAIKFWWDDAGVWQDVTVIGGQEYDFGVQVFNYSQDQLLGWNGLIKAEFYNSALGTDAANRLLEVDIDKYYSDGGLVDQWVELGGTVTAPATADIARIVLVIADWQSTGVGGSLNFDNATITPVPEPSALFVLGLGALVLIRRR